MKCLFILLLVVFATNAVAEDSPFDANNNRKPTVYTQCLGGHLFAIASSKNGVAIMQIFKDVGDMVPKPIECETNENQ